jgi:predicted nuclease of predicted toxin-antitoxin system
LRLLLDEQYSRQIAEQLRERGYDVIAVKEQAELEGIDDERLLRRARDEGRALLTNNVSDFVLLLRDWTRQGDEHAGMIFTSDESMPRSRGTIGLYLKQVSKLLDANPADDAFRNRVEWLTADD